MSLRLGHRKVQREAAARRVDRVKHSTSIGADRSVGAGQKSHQVRRACRLDSDYVGSQSAQPRGRVRHGKDPAEVGDANSFQRLFQFFQEIPAGDSVAVGDGTIPEYFFVVLAEPRRAAHDSPRSAREFARRTRHPHFARRGMIDFDKKFARLVLLVVRDFGRRMHREAWHVLGLVPLECLSSRNRR